MMQNLYCFDFDGTLTKHDTLFMFLKFYHKKKYYMQYIRHIPLFLGCKLRMIDTERVKKRFIRSIIGGESKKALQKKGKDFFSEKYETVCREKAVAFLGKINRGENDCFLVSASLDIWVKPFADYFNMELVSTEAKYENDLFTGDFQTKNCIGAEKVNRIEKIIAGKKYNQIIAFGDSAGDREMLAWADIAYFRFFH